MKYLPYLALAVIIAVFGLVRSSNFVRYFSDPDFFAPVSAQALDVARAGSTALLPVAPRRLDLYEITLDAVMRIDAPQRMDRLQGEVRITVLAGESVIERRTMNLDGEADVRQRGAVRRIFLGKYDLSSVPLDAPVSFDVRIIRPIRPWVSRAASVRCIVKAGYSAK